MTEQELAWLNASLPPHTKENSTAKDIERIADALEQIATVLTAIARDAAEKEMQAEQPLVFQTQEGMVQIG